MRHTGFASLPLHTGKAPAWLFARMVRLSRQVVLHLVHDQGRQELLRRLSDPFWFQAFGCVLGFDWHSSGVTTTVCGALKEGLRDVERELGIFVAGGKGAASRKTPLEITAACEQLGHDPAALVRASRMAAKVDHAAVQDGYQLYHHVLVFTADGEWCVVQQGMSDTTRMARRYHWLSEQVTSFTDEPHSAVCCDARGCALNLVAHESAAARESAAALARQTPDATLQDMQAVPTLLMPKRHMLFPELDVDERRLHTILLKTYERAPRNFDELIGIEGVGPRTLRALALTAELIHGTPASTRDPARFAFAHGGKDGIPFPVDRGTYDRTIDVLSHAIRRARIDQSEKRRAFERLTTWAEKTGPREDAPGGVTTG